MNLRISILGASFLLLMVIINVYYGMDFNARKRNVVFVQPKQWFPVSGVDFFLFNNFYFNVHRKYLRFKLEKEIHFEPFKY